MHVAYGAITLWGTASQQFPLYRRLVTLLVQVRCPHLTTLLSEERSLGFSLFARRYSGYYESRVPFKQTYCLKRTQLILFSFPPGTEMFHFPGFASRRRYPADFLFETGRVSPFGDLRIKGYKPPPRSFSQVSRVLHRRPRPRHPPCTLNRLPCGDLYSTIYLHFATSQHHCCEDFYYHLCVFVCQRSVSPETKEPPEAVLSALTRAGLTAYPLLKVWFFRFVDT